MHIAIRPFAIWPHQATMKTTSSTLYSDNNQKQDYIRIMVTVGLAIHYMSLNKSNEIAQANETAQANEIAQAKKG